MATIPPFRRSACVAMASACASCQRGIAVATCGTAAAESARAAVKEKQAPLIPITTQVTIAITDFMSRRLRILKRVGWGWGVDRTQHGCRNEHGTVAHAYQRASLLRPFCCNRVPAGRALFRCAQFCRELPQLDVAIREPPQLDHDLRGRRRVGLTRRVDVS